MGLADVLAEVSDAEIDTAREEVKKFAVGIGGVAHALRLFGSEWAYGIGGWGLFIDQMLSTHDGQAYLVLIWLRILQAGLGPGATEVLTELEKQPGLREQVDLLAGLFNAIPELRQALPMDWYERALRDPSYQARINATFADLRLDCTPRYVRRLVMERRIPFVKLGGSKVRFSVNELEKWIDAQRVSPVRR